MLDYYFNDKINTIKMTLIHHQKMVEQALAAYKDNRCFKNKVSLNKAIENLKYFKIYFYKIQQPKNEE